MDQMLAMIGSRSRRSRSRKFDHLGIYRATMTIEITKTCRIPQNSKEKKSQGNENFFRGNDAGINYNWGKIRP